MQASLDDFPPGSKAEFWYIKACEAYVTFDGDKAKFMNQASLWLMDEDLGFASMAWDLVAWEKDEHS